MSIKVICDGCERPTEDFVEVGLAVKRQYGKACGCAERWEGMDRAIDAAHKLAVEHFRNDVEAAKSAARQHLKVLPDE